MSRGFMRADILMVEMGLAPSRSRAQELIDSGRVHFIIRGEKKTVSKASMKIGSEEASTLSVDAEPNGQVFVSRGGIKLSGALERLRLNIIGKRALDVGQSTGGFTDCLLQAGAKRVVGVDVGHGQLVQRLKDDSRVRFFEGVNARDLAQPEWVRAILDSADGEKFDIAVIDVSFISLTLVLPEVIQYLKESGLVVALVKPQFEVGREGLGKGGIVKDLAKFAEVENKIRACCLSIGLSVEDYFESSIEGSDGNREFFLLAKPSQLTLGGF